MTPLESVSSFFERYPEYGGQQITLAFSGGYDSLCLLACLSHLGFSVQPVYVNHNLRGRKELSDEIEVNRANCAVFGCTLEVITIEKGKIDSYARDHGLTCEAAARSLRYEILSRFPLVATAHNKDDQVESLMMKLISGGTFLSLAGIREKRGGIIRPLLECARSEIESYVNSLHLSPSSDSTNDELFCFRNKVRFLVTPYLDSSVKKRLLNISKNIQIIEDNAETISVDEVSGYYRVSRERFLNASSISRLKCIYSIYSIFDPGRLSDAEVSHIVDSCLDGRSYDSYFFHMRCTADEIRFYHLKTWFALPFVKGTFLPHGLMLDESCAADALRIDMRKIHFPALIRLSGEDDTIVLSGHSVRVAGLCASYKCPYAFVLQDMDGIKAVWARCFGGRNRISDTLKSPQWKNLPGLEMTKKH